MVASTASALFAERPFPGLRPFAFSDHAFFYGRKTQFYDLYNLVDLNRFIAVVGSSGCGKSSLVRAGLLPLLQEESDDAAGRHWRWVEMHPGDAPIEQLGRALIGLASSVATDDDAALAAARAERIAYCLRSDSSGVAAALGEIAGLAGTSLVILVDQFEELFRFAGSTGTRPDAGRSREEATHFVQLLLAASRTTTHDVRVMITMRSDFIGDCARFQGLPEAVSETQFLVPSLTRDQREQVIRGPLRQAGATIDSALVERLLNDGQDEDDQLPVLQHCLLRLWEQAGAAPVAAPSASAAGAPPEAAAASEAVRAGRHIALAHYESIGGIAQALSQHANEILASLCGLEIAVEQAFRALSELDKEGRATRRALKFEQLVAEAGVSRKEVRRVIDRFRADDCSFLTPSPSTVEEVADDTRIDVGHEALLRRWARVSGDASDQRQIGWLREEARDGRRYQALLSLVESDASGRTTLPLDQVASRRSWWSERPRTDAWAERYGGGHGRVVRLLEDSEAALAAEIERKRKEEEKAQLDLLNKAKVERLTRIAAAAFFVLFLVACGFGVWAYMERQNANTERQVAETARQTAEQSLKIAVDQARLLVKEILDDLNSGAISTVAARGLADRSEQTLNQLEPYATTPTIKVVKAELLSASCDVFETLGDMEMAFKKAESAEVLGHDLIKVGVKSSRGALFAALVRVADLRIDPQSPHYDRTRALKEFDEAREIAQEMYDEKHDGNSGYNLAYITNKIAEALQPDYAAAIAQFRTALKIGEDIAALPKADVAWRAYPASMMTKIGTALARQKTPDWNGAMAQFAAAMQLQDALLRDGESDVVRSNLALTHYAKASALVSLSKSEAQTDASKSAADLQAAFQEFEQVIAIYERLADKDPGNSIWLVRLATYASFYGNALRDAQKTTDAIAQYSKAYKTYERLINRDPCNAAWNGALQRILAQLAKLNAGNTAVVATAVCATKPAATPAN